MFLKVPLILALTSFAITVSCVNESIFFCNSNFCYAVSNFWNHSHIFFNHWLGIYNQKKSEQNLINTLTFSKINIVVTRPNLKSYCLLSSPFLKVKTLCKKNLKPISVQRQAPCLEPTKYCLKHIYFFQTDLEFFFCYYWSLVALTSNELGCVRLKEWRGHIKPIV